MYIVVDRAIKILSLVFFGKWYRYEIWRLNHADMQKAYISLGLHFNKQHQNNIG